mgnify:CR=1 FL=1
MGVLLYSYKCSIYTAILLGIPIVNLAQKIEDKGFTDPYTINVAGGTWRQNNNWIDWSLGESTLIKTFYKHPILLLSFGFLQSGYDPLLLFKSLDSFDLQIKVGPNPFQSKVFIQSKQDGIAIIKVQVMNFRGDIIYYFPGIYAGLHYYLEIPIQKLNNPIYYLYIQYRIGENTERTKIIKLIQH